MQDAPTRTFKEVVTAHSKDKHVIMAGGRVPHGDAVAAHHRANALYVVVRSDLYGLRDGGVQLLAVSHATAWRHGGDHLSRLCVPRTPCCAASSCRFNLCVVVLRLLMCVCAHARSVSVPWP
jgi:hypothetical protein